MIASARSSGRAPVLAVAAVLSLLAVGCERGGGVDAARVDALDKKVADLDGRLAKLERFLKDYIDQPPPPPEPDPAAVYAVPVEGAPSRGPAAAPVTIVEAFEFACPYCERVRPTIDEVRKAYGDKVRVVYKQFVVHPEIATVPALAACAAALQGKFDAFETLVWEKGFKEQDLGEEKMSALAKEAKLDVARFESDRKGPACAAQLERDQADLRRLGVSGTPAFYVNGRSLIGAQPLPAFKKLIDEELAKAEQAIAAGTPVADYYRVAVLEKGLKELAAPAAPAAAPTAPQVAQ